MPPIFTECRPCDQVRESCNVLIWFFCSSVNWTPARASFNMPSAGLFNALPNWSDALLMSRKDQTRMQETERAVRDLADAGGRIVGTLMNAY